MATGEACSICGSPLGDDFGEGFAASYPGLVCRTCGSRAVDRDHRPAEFSSGHVDEDGKLHMYDPTVPNPVWIDGAKCWRRYRFGGEVTMRDPADSDTLEAFYRVSVGMGTSGRQDMDATARITGGLFGLVVGDALGVPVQFRPRAEVKADPVEGMDRSFRSYPPGTWSDDSSMALALADSLAENGGRS